MRINSILATAVVAGAALTLSACGGSDDGGTPVTAAVPATAGQSSANFLDYVKQLVASVNTDDFTPVDLSGLTTPPEDNDSAPLVLQ